jgi:hypothetical protein
MRNLPAWSAQEAAHFDARGFLLRGYGQLRRTLRALAGHQTKELDPLIYFGEASLPGAYQSFLTAMYRAMHSYVPARYEGKVVLFAGQGANAISKWPSHDGLGDGGGRRGGGESDTREA